MHLAASYGCLLFEPPEDVATLVRGHQILIPQEYLGSDGIEDHVHVTVKYGIHTKDADEVARVLAGQKPFGVTLGGVDVFASSTDFIVLKVTMHSPGLRALNRYVSRELEHTDTHPEYNPHMTLAYLKKNERNPMYYQEFVTNMFRGISFVVDELVFSDSDEVETVIPLKEAI